MHLSQWGWPMKKREVIEVIAFFRTALQLSIRNECELLLLP